MKLLALLVPLILAGCAASEPYSPVRDVRYSARGEDPFWMVAIGDDRIVLSFGPAEGGGKGRHGLRSHAYPRVLPRIVDGATRWESGTGTAVIGIEARPGPCSLARGRRYQDSVRVRLSGRELHGCGGRPLERERG